jgi:hypothetical protein
MAVDLNPIFDLIINGELKVPIGDEGVKRHYLGKKCDKTFLLTEFGDGTSNTYYLREEIEKEFNRIYKLDLENGLKKQVVELLKAINS